MFIEWLSPDLLSDPIFNIFVIVRFFLCCNHDTTSNINERKIALLWLRCSIYCMRSCYCLMESHFLKCTAIQRQQVFGLCGYFVLSFTWYMGSPVELSWGTRMIGTSPCCFVRHVASQADMFLCLCALTHLSVRDFLVSFNVKLSIIITWSLMETLFVQHLIIDAHSDCWVIQLLLLNIFGVDEQMK